MSVRAKFAELFGEEQCAAIERAASGHKNGVHDREGSDPFKWALCICIGFECMSRDSFRAEHGITVPWEALRQAIKDHGALDTHDGDVDFLAMFAGVYQEFMPQTEATKESL